MAHIISVFHVFTSCSIKNRNHKSQESEEQGVTREELRKGFIFFAILTLVFGLMLPIVYAFGIRFGKRSTDSWETTKVHYEMSVDGYNYCPYCGAKIEEIEE